MQRSTKLGAVVQRESVRVLCSKGLEQMLLVEHSVFERFLKHKAWPRKICHVGANRAPPARAGGVVEKSRSHTPVVARAAHERLQLRRRGLRRLLSQFQRPSNMLWQIITIEQFQHLVFRSAIHLDALRANPLDQLRDIRTRRHGAAGQNLHLSVEPRLGVTDEIDRRFTGLPIDPNATVVYPGVENPDGLFVIGKPDRAPRQSAFRPHVLGAVLSEALKLLGVIFRFVPQWRIVGCVSPLRGLRGTEKNRIRKSPSLSFCSDKLVLLRLERERIAGGQRDAGVGRLPLQLVDGPGEGRREKLVRHLGSFGNRRDLLKLDPGFFLEGPQFGKLIGGGGDVVDLSPAGVRVLPVQLVQRRVGLVQLILLTAFSPTSKKAPPPQTHQCQHDHAAHQEEQVPFDPGHTTA